MRLLKPKYFKATWGDVSTTTPYRRPTLEAFANWWLEFKTIKGLEDYNVSLVGSFCEKHFGSYKGNPRDLDICLTGELKDEEQLKYILSHGISLGFKHKMLVDLTWATEISRYDKWEPRCIIRVGKTFTRIMGDDVYVQEYKADDERKLDCGIWAFCFKEPPNSWFKALNRYDNGAYEGLMADVREMFG